MAENSSGNNKMELTLFSFGFKHGMPTEANMVWSVRFLPNPHWVEDLRPLTGLEKEVSDYVVKSREGKEFINLLEPLLDFLVKNNASSNKKEMSLAIGCTGGRHRSVAVVEKLKHLFGDAPVNLKVYHRDIDRESE